MRFDGLDKIKDMSLEEANEWLLKDMQKMTRQTVILAFFGILALVLVLAFAGQ